MSKKKAKKKPALVPRLGPPVNIRHGGAHKEQRERPRGVTEREALEAQREASGEE